MLFKKFRFHNERLNEELERRRAENGAAEKALIVELAHRMAEIDDPDLRAYALSKFSPELQKSAAIQDVLLTPRLRKPSAPRP
jgi:hypothetical protein